MAGITRAFGGSCSRPGKGRKVFAVTAVLILLGIMSSSPGEPGQVPHTLLPSPQQSPQQNPQQNRIPQVTPPDFPKPNQRRERALLDDNFKKMKKDAEDLAELAASLQKEIEKSNENVLSLEIIKKADQVEKLAKKIKKEAKGY